LAAWGPDLPWAAFPITFAATMGLYYIGYEGTHYLMHRPTFGWVERSRPFQFIKRHHKIHHVHMNRNLNVLLPLADLVLGTLVLTAPESTPTSASARQVARRHSRYGRRVRAEQKKSDRRGDSDGGGTRGGS
jgi:sterol desaturase/sphingolipid hydroxylase (fatty acid hydroxylase superfamily)